MHVKFRFNKRNYSNTQEECMKKRAVLTVIVALLLMWQAPATAGEVDILKKDG